MIHNNPRTAEQAPATRPCGCGFGQGCRTNCLSCYWGAHYDCSVPECRCTHTCVRQGARS